VCEQCRPTLARPKKPVCFLCNSLSEDFKTCANCRPKTPLKRVWVASRYEAYIKQLIREFKFERKRVAHVPLGYIISQIITARDYDLVSSVPCASSRFRRRGYNQSQLLAKTVANNLQITYRDTLFRYGQAEQVGRTRSQRLLQPADIFRLASPVDGKKILLIDDVTTTGATLNNCAKVLKQAGAKRIEAAVIAKS